MTAKQFSPCRMIILDINQQQQQQQTKKQKNKDGLYNFKNEIALPIEIISQNYLWQPWDKIPWLWKGIKKFPALIQDSLTFPCPWQPWCIFRQSTQALKNLRADYVLTFFTLTQINTFCTGTGLKFMECMDRKSLPCPCKKVKNRSQKPWNPWSISSYNGEWFNYRKDKPPYPSPYRHQYCSPDFHIIKRTKMSVQVKPLYQAYLSPS